MKKRMDHSSCIMIKHLFRNKVSTMMFLSMFFLMSEVSAEKLITYPAPEGYAKSLTYIVTVNGRPSPVYYARINDPDNCGYTYFDFEGTVHIIVTVPAGFESVMFRPQSAGIKPTVKGNKIEFDMTEDKAFGRIHDIYFKNILVIDGNPAPSEIISTGLDDFYDSTKVRPGQLIENVTFENLNILGKTIMNVQEGGFIVYPSAVNLKFIK